MTDVSISIPDAVREYAESRASQGGYKTVSDYLVRLIEEDRKRNAREELEGLLLEGLDSGPDLEPTPEWRERFLAEAAERHRTMGAR
jgi:antitoxin ParD1/3/4